MKTIIVTAGVVVEHGKVLVTQRKKEALHGLLWEFPGGKMVVGEGPRLALQRELREELGIEVEVKRIFEAVYHIYPEYPILLLAYYCRIKKGVLKPLGCRDLRWVTLEELKKLAMPPADGPIRKYLSSSKLET
jgi:8-oxo-dGTP diphosphatase